MENEALINTLVFSHRSLRYTTVRTTSGRCNTVTFSAGIDNVTRSRPPPRRPPPRRKEHKGRKRMARKSSPQYDPSDDVPSDQQHNLGAVRARASIMASELLALPPDHPVKHRHLAYFEITPARADLSWAKVADLTFCHVEVILALNKGLRGADGSMPALRDIVGEDIFVCT